MATRAAAILTLVLIGAMAVSFGVARLFGDEFANFAVGAGAFLLAYVYAQLTKPRRPLS